MRAITITKFLRAVICAMVALWASPVLRGQAQSPEALTELQTSSFDLPGFLDEPQPPIPEYPAPGSGTEGTTPILHESAKLTASDAKRFDGFGLSVSISGNTAIVGAIGDNCAAGLSCGSAYVFRLDGTNWVEEQELTPADAGAGDFFGFSVSVSGETAVVGAVRDVCAEGDDCGSAYVFRFEDTNWVQEKKLTASDAGHEDEFGRTVSVNGNTVVVGANGDDCAAGEKCGSAYVYRFNGSDWFEEQKLTASEAGARDKFGVSVSVSADTVLVGASGDNCSAFFSCGSAYVFRFNGTSWVNEQKLTASDAAQGDHFGNSVSVNGDIAVVGASGDDCGAGIICGSAYVFRFNGAGWVDEHKLTASDSEDLDFFGSSVSISGDTAVVGAPGDECAAGSQCGSAYVFRYNGASWSEQQQLIASDAYTGDNFGTSVSLSGSRILIGSFQDDRPQGIDRGATYVFDLPPTQLRVTIDIKPGNDINPVNLGARGVLPVAVLTTSVDDGDLTDFDAADVDPSSLTLAGAAPRMKGRSGRIGSLADIDGDADLDLLVHFPIAELGLTVDDTEAVLLGETFDGTPIRGSDTISVRGFHRLGSENLRRVE